MGSFGTDSSICIGRENGQKEKLQLPKDSLINLYHGDPTMFESFWRRAGDRCSILITGWQKMSYFSDSRNICWFLEHELADEVRKMHRLVGNDIVGNALSDADAPQPMNVVSAVPNYTFLISTGAAWLKCEKEADCESFLRRHNIMGRSGKRFGADPEYARISMLDRDEAFDLLIGKLLEIQ